MPIITIYHNPRCSKSRECHLLLSDSKKDIEVINYMKTPFSEEKLREVIGLLGIAPLELIRKNEAIWKENYKGKTLSDTALINAMLAHPKLIERPIVVFENSAIIARPPEKVLALIS